MPKSERMMTTKKQLPSRSSRGNRIHKLIGEEAEADDSFWNQDAWNEEGEDSDYASEEEEEDVVDSDFDVDEQPDDDVHEGDDDGGREQQLSNKKRSGYQEPQRAGAAKRPRRSSAPPIAIGVSMTEEGQQRQPTLAPSATAVLLPYQAPQLRQSTARKSSESSDLRRKIHDEAARLAAKTKKTTSATRLRLTQEQLLVEAVQTEVTNTQSLNRLERLEEEKKAENAIAPKAPFTGVIVRYHSRIGMPKTITFLNTEQFPSIFNQPPAKKRERVVMRSKEEEEEDEDDEEPVEDEQEDEEEEEEEGTTADEETGEETADE